MALIVPHLNAEICPPPPPPLFLPTPHLHTLRASLSGTFLQILPKLITPLKAHSIFVFTQLSAY